MKKWIKLAVRNITRNKRRSTATLLAIGVGFAAITLFYGYTSNVYRSLRMSAIQGEGLGHLTIYKQGWLEKGKLDPERYMFSQAEIEKITRLAEEDKNVVLATPQIEVSGLVSNGSVSMIFIAQGVIPKDYTTIKGTWATMRPTAGESLSEKKPYGVEVAAGPGQIPEPWTGEGRGCHGHDPGRTDERHGHAGGRRVRFRVGCHERQVYAVHLRLRPVALRHEHGGEDRGPPRRLAKDGEDALRPPDKARRRRHREQHKDVERAFPVLLEGEGHVRHDLPLHILHSAGDRGDEHGEHHGYGGAGEDAGDRDLAGPRPQEAGRFASFLPWRAPCWASSGASWASPCT